MSRPLLDALSLKAVSPPPIWIMRQAGRHLPEYREIRERHSFSEVVRTPGLAAEVTLQPVTRYDMDGAVIFADIMTPLEAMGVDVEFAPGPRLEPLGLEEILDLPELEPDGVGHVLETIGLVRTGLSSDKAVIGFAGAPVTLLAYLMEGGGSKEFMRMRSALRSEPDLAGEALLAVGRSMNKYLRAQIEAGADVVQLFDTWAGLLDVEAYEHFAVPSARAALESLSAPTIYFAPGAGHTLKVQSKVGASGVGVDWRVPLEVAFSGLDGHAIQGNLDPAVLLSDPDTVRSAVERMMSQVAGRPGYVANLGHGIDRNTPPANVDAFVEAVRS